MWADKIDISQLIKQVASGEAEAYRKLTRIGIDNSNSISDLLENLSHPDQSTRQAVAIALSNLSHPETNFQLGHHLPMLRNF